MHFKKLKDGHLAEGSGETAGWVDVGVRRYASTDGDTAPEYLDGS